MQQQDEPFLESSREYFTNEDRANIEALKSAFPSLARLIDVIQGNEKERRTKESFENLRLNKTIIQSEDLSLVFGDIIEEQKETISILEKLLGISSNSTNILTGIVTAAGLLSAGSLVMGGAAALLGLVNGNDEPPEETDGDDLPPPVESLPAIPQTPPPIPAPEDIIRLPGESTEDFNRRVREAQERLLDSIRNAPTTAIPLPPPPAPITPPTPIAPITAIPLPPAPPAPIAPIAPPPAPPAPITPPPAPAPITPPPPPAPAPIAPPPPAPAPIAPIAPPPAPQATSTTQATPTASALTSLTPTTPTAPVTPSPESQIQSIQPIETTPITRPTQIPETLSVPTITNDIFREQPRLRGLASVLRAQIRSAPNEQIAINNVNRFLENNGFDENIRRRVINQLLAERNQPRNQTRSNIIPQSFNPSTSLNANVDIPRFIEISGQEIEPNESDDLNVRANNITFKGNITFNNELQQQNLTPQTAPAAGLGGMSPNGDGAGAQLSMLSQENAMVDAGGGSAPLAPIEVTTGGAQVPDGNVRSPEYLHSVNDPGNVEPEDAPTRYRSLFKMN